MRKFRVFFQMIEENVGKDTSFLTRIYFVWQYLLGRIAIKANKREFFLFKLYEKNQYGKKQIVAEHRKMNFVRTVNNMEAGEIFADKVRFIKRFSDYIGRDTLDMEKATETDFRSFVGKHNNFFVKPVDGYFGIGAYIGSCNSEENIAEEFKKLAGKKMLLEELICQHEEMAKFNESSVNSLRVVTFLHADNTPEIIDGAAIRIGRKGKNADNFHHHGIGAKIDLETGIVCTMGIDRDRCQYVVHPDSGVPIVGFKVPHWAEVCELVKKAALEVPEVRYVGWDVALTRDGRVILIEGNDKADPDLAQICSGIGAGPMFRSLAKEVEKTIT